MPIKTENVGFHEQDCGILATAILTLFHADIFCGPFLDNLNEGFELSPALMKRISDRNLKIGFDIHSPTDSWESKSDENSP
ncbi:MAG: hypothetical protein ACOYYS_22540 [Chloroflexota bacterium]